MDDLDRVRANAAITTAARMLVENRDRSDALAARLREAAKHRGADFDCNIQTAEGSAAAYAVACSILAGAAGVPSIDDLTGGWRMRDMAPPTLPEPDAVQFAPGDDIAAATVIRNRLNRSDTIVHHQIHPCDLPDGHDGECWYESGTPDD